MGAQTGWRPQCLPVGTRSRFGCGQWTSLGVPLDWSVASEAQPTPRSVQISQHRRPIACNGRRTSVCWCSSPRLVSSPDQSNAAPTIAIGSCTVMLLGWRGSAASHATKARTAVAASHAAARNPSTHHKVEFYFVIGPPMTSFRRVRSPAFQASTNILPLGLIFTV